MGMIGSPGAFHELAEPETERSMTEPERALGRMEERRSRSSSFRVWWNTRGRLQKPFKESAVLSTVTAFCCPRCMATDVKICEHMSVKGNVERTEEACSTPDGNSLATLVGEMEAVPERRKQEPHPESDDGIEDWEEWRNVINAVQNACPRHPSSEQAPTRTSPVSVLNRKRGQNL
jgi:hypothetical protein